MTSPCYFPLTIGFNQGEWQREQETNTFQLSPMIKSGCDNDVDIENARQKGERWV